MDNSFKYFENRDCCYYPCHEGLQELNCLFCYCPFFFLEDCPGTPATMEKEGRTIRVCTGCTYPHRAENYGEIVRQLHAILVGN